MTENKTISQSSNSQNHHHYSNPVRFQRVCICEFSLKSKFFYANPQGYMHVWIVFDGTGGQTQDWGCILSRREGILLKWNTENWQQSAFAFFFQVII